MELMDVSGKAQKVNIQVVKPVYLVDDLITHMHLAGKQNVLLILTKE